MRDLVRVVATGGVDDGKSTLMGRLLRDAAGAADDQLRDVERVSRERGREGTDLALLTDGLRAERDRGITIDVAHRSLETPRRRFLLADAPGHVRYTRNTVTGASTADVALIVADARRGVDARTRRHIVLCGLLGVPHLVLVVNKMDLIGWDRQGFDAVRDEFSRFCARLGVAQEVALPVSARSGDGVARASAAMPWSPGPLLQHLESLRLGAEPEAAPLRFPVQTVLRHDGGDAGLAGVVASGVLRRGDRVSVMPSGAGSTVTAIDGPGGPVAMAVPPMSVVVRLADDLGLRRGDLLSDPVDRPAVLQDVVAQVCWFDEAADLAAGRVLAVKHTTRWTRAEVVEVVDRLDLATLDRDGRAAGLAANEVGRVRLRTADPLSVDPYSVNRTTGSFILVDERSDRTVGAGVVVGP